MPKTKQKKDDKNFEERLAAAEDKFDSTFETMVKARDELWEKQDFVAKGFELAGDDLDFKSPKVLAHFDASDSEGAAKKLRGYNDEAGLLQIRYDAASSLHRIAKAQLDELIGKSEPRFDEPLERPPLPGGEKQEAPNLGRLVMESEPLKAYKEAGAQGQGIVKGYTLRDLKTLFQTSAGWAPESTRVPGLVIPYATRPIQVLDIIPQGNTQQAAVVYMEETTLTHSSAERNEGAAYAESAFALTEQSSTVRSIGSSIPVTDEQLEDVEGVQSYLEGRLTFGNRQRLDYQVLNGNGVAPNLDGILNNGNLQTNANAGEPVPDTIYYCMTDIRVTGRANPNAVVFHPNDWQDIRLLRTADGIYIWGSPSEAGPERIWGLQVVQSDALSENTGLVGDFANFCQLYERRGMEVMIGWDSDDFSKGIRTIRAGFRVAFVVYRGAAFCTATSI